MIDGFDATVAITMPDTFTRFEIGIATPELKGPKMTFTLASTRLCATVMPVRGSAASSCETSSKRVFWPPITRPSAFRRSIAILTPFSSSLPMAACGPVKGPVKPILTTCSPAVAPTDIMLKATAANQLAPAYGFFIMLSSPRVTCQTVPSPEVANASRFGTENIAWAAAVRMLFRSPGQWG